MLFVLLNLLAQSQFPLQSLRLVYVQQQQIDQQQARLDGLGESYMRVSLLQPTLSSAGLLEVSGWAFACGESTGTRLAVMIDGTPSVQAEGPDLHFGHFEWPGVNNEWNAALCAQIGTTVPSTPGFFTLVDLSLYGAGWNGDGWHTVEVRLFNNAGKMARSATLSFWKAP